MQAPQHSRFNVKLREQLKFLKTSCDLFDRGDEEESLRLATAMRTIFHNTQASVSIFSHLGMKTFNLLSSSRGHGDWKDYAAHKLDFTSPNPVRMTPLLGDQFSTVPFSEWWAVERIFSHGNESFSRRNVILSAANKDGGAHVDGKLDEYYKVLCAGEYAVGITGDITFDGPAPFSQGVTHFPTNAHFVLIRQFAHEVLCSASHFSWL